MGVIEVVLAGEFELTIIVVPIESHAYFTNDLRRGVPWTKVYKQYSEEFSYPPDPKTGKPDRTSARHWPETALWEFGAVKVRHSVDLARFSL